MPTRGMILVECIYLKAMDVGEEGGTLNLKGCQALAPVTGLTTENFGFHHVIKHLDTSAQTRISWWIQGAMVPLILVRYHKAYNFTCCGC
jgi:hypothetical protein